MSNEKKEICNIKKEIHADVAAYFKLDYEPVDCLFPGGCPDNCIVCDVEQRRLEMQLDERRINRLNWSMMLELRMCPKEENHASQQVAEPTTDYEEEYSHIDKKTYKSKTRTAYYDENADKKLLKKFWIAGIRYHEANQIFFDLCLEDEVWLQREPTNPYDSNGILVMCEVDGRNYRLGYVPKEENKDLAALLDMGWGHTLYSTVSNMMYRTGIEIAIYVKNKKYIQG